MIEQALPWLAPAPDELVMDLSCGLGNSAFQLAGLVKEEVAVEGVATMVERAAVNAMSNDLHNVQFFQPDQSPPLTPADW
ncbi:23S rRNA (uracil(1939)-C(5))-methyltransferase RlmD, partial [Pseudomonas syringae pv. tagetis]